MKWILRILLSTCVVIANQVVPLHAHANSAFNDGSYERTRIDLLSDKNWIQVDSIESEPQGLKIGLITSNEVEFPIVTFSQNGPSLPTLASFFKDTVNSRQNLFFIVKWHYYLSAADTEGDFYEVHVFDVSGTSLKPRFSENQVLSERFGSGFDGRQDGHVVRFHFKDAASIRRALRHREAK
jgi:hypothetical protein